MALEEYPPLSEAELDAWEERARGPKDWSADYILHLIAEIRRLRKALTEATQQRSAAEARPIWEEIVEVMQDVPNPDYSPCA